MTNIKSLKVDFQDFGLNTPTRICAKIGNETLTWSCTGKSVEQIADRIKCIVSLWAPYKVIYTTSPYLLNQIKSRSLANPLTTVWELFCKEGIIIECQS